MFKKFTRDESIQNFHQLKSSQQKKVARSVVDTYPMLEDVLEDIFPKKKAVWEAKCQNFLTLYIVDDRVVFFQPRDAPFIPTLRILHKYPSMLPKMQVDRGAAKFIMTGAQITCPGLTSPGGRMDDVEEGTIVAVMVEGKEHPVAIGVTLMSTEQIQSVNSGYAIDNIHYLGDGLWTIPKLDQK